jgi:ABC-type sugar transport system permease subunit
MPWGEIKKMNNWFNSDDTWAKRFSAWGALLVTVSVFALFAVGLVFSALSQNPPTAFSNLMETVKALAMVCAGYWVGSSNSSQKKDETIAQNSVALANSQPITPSPLALDIPSKVT